MPAVKPIDRVARKWIERARVAGPEYEAGVSAPRTPWDAAAAAAEGIWREAVTRAATEGRFGAGVKAAGLAKWQTRAKAKGPSRFAEGVAIAEPDFRAGWQPIRAAIEAAQLPARGPKGSPGQVQRFAAMRDALIAAGRARRGMAR
jgi:hypothetical protein